MGMEPVCSVPAREAAGLGAFPISYPPSTVSRRGKISQIYRERQTVRTRGAKAAVQTALNLVAGDLLELRAWATLPLRRRVPRLFFASSGRLYVVRLFAQ